MGLNCTVSEINEDFSRKQQFSLPGVFNAPLKGFPLGVWVPALRDKTWNEGATGPGRKFDDIVNRLDTMHERDRRTDRRTSPDFKNRAYAWRRCENIHSN